jgi:hypothetical protein
MVAASSVPLFWDVVELFGTDPGEWKLTNSRFELRRRVDMEGGWLLTAILDAFTMGPGYRRLYSWSNVRLFPPSQDASRRARRASWLVMLTQAFAKRGYSRGVDPHSFARRLRGAPAHAAERAWIEALFGVESRGATKARAQAEAPVWTALRAFAGDGAGEWVPVNSDPRTGEGACEREERRAPVGAGARGPDPGPEGEEAQRRSATSRRSPSSNRGSSRGT